jgi:hypothetical protein
LNWFRQLALYGKVSSEDYEKLDYIYRTREEVQTMLAATLHEERQKIYQRGQVEGEAVGIVKGQRQTLLQLLQFRFQLSEAEQTDLMQQLETISQAQALTALTDHGLQAATFAEFNTYLLKYLPSDNDA